MAAAPARCAERNLVDGGLGAPGWLGVAGLARAERAGRAHRPALLRRGRARAPRASPDPGHAAVARAVPGERTLAWTPGQVARTPALARGRRLGARAAGAGQRAAAGAPGLRLRLLAGGAAA